MRIFISTLILITGICHSAFAQQFGTTLPEPFAGTGSAELRRPATQLVAWIPLKASGANVREATKSLQQKVSDVKEKLSELGVQEASMVTTAFAINEQTADVQRRMMMQMGRGTFGRGDDDSPDAGEQGDAVITVKTFVRGYWKLDGTSGEDVLVAASELQDAINNAKLCEDDSSESLTPEQQEMLEEAQMFSESGNDENLTKPVFAFLASVTPQERAALIKQAFEMAEAEARELANATGAELGSVGTIRHSQDLDYGGSGYDYGYQSPQPVTELTSEIQGNRPVLQMIGNSPTELVFKIHILAGFNPKSK